MNNEVLAINGTMENKVFKFPVRIYYEDTDAGGIVYYANYLKYAERARTEYLRFIGIENQNERLENEAAGFVVRHLEIDYKMPAKLDDLLTVSCEVIELKGAGALMKQQISRGDDILAEITVKVAYVSLLKKRPLRIPKELIEKMG